MADRTFEVGGEVLSAGDTVIVFDGNSQREKKILSIGTKRIQIAGDFGNPVPYSLEDRRNCEKRGYSSYFRTRTEVEELKVRSALKATLLNLGVHFLVGVSQTDSLSPYPNSVLEQMVTLLQGHLDQVNRGQSS